MDGKKVEDERKDYREKVEDSEFDEVKIRVKVRKGDSWVTIKNIKEKLVQKEK